MGELFRSEDMLLCQLYLQAEAAYACISQLGELAVVQFRDLNTEQNAFSKKFVHEIRRCEEMERQLRFFEKEVNSKDGQVQEVGSNPEAPAPRDMIDLEAQFEKHESEMKELNNNIDALKRNYTELYELKFVLTYTEQFMLESGLNVIDDPGGLVGYPQAQGDFELSSMQQGVDVERRTYLGYVAGVIARERTEGFMRMLWFACRGNVFIKHADIDEPLENSATGDCARKSVFMVFFQGEQLKTKIRKICEGYRATLYPCPDTMDDRREMAIGVMSRLQDLEHVLGKSVEQRQRVLETVADNLNTWYIKFLPLVRKKYISSGRNLTLNNRVRDELEFLWRILLQRRKPLVLKIKAIYHTMNMFHTEGQNYIAECYLPEESLGLVQSVLNNASAKIGVSAPCLIHPIAHDQLPTYHKTNKFTKAYQNIIDAYGVACYKEVNPAPFAIITFPFLFSVMFGDAGHGLIMFLFALWMVVYEDRIRKMMESSDIFSMIYAGRYVILLMGIFSVYAGLIYNDCFAKSFNIFGSAWKGIYDLNYTRVNPLLQLDANDSEVYGGAPYPFGMDPIWQISENKITYSNSYKEKISIIFGVTQMVLGVCLGIFNHIKFKQYLNIFCEFIPMLVFLLCMFGYMVCLIISKWILYDASRSNEAPNILIGYINMFLFSYKEDDVKSNLPWFPGQKYLQIVLVLTALVCALVMLLAKPLILRQRHKSKMRAESLLSQDQFLDLNQDPGASTTEDGDDEMLNHRGTLNGITVDLVIIQEEEFEFSEVFIGQAIHTIEYCLGCISHTASYLRLWALSLAHTQLSEVLWNMVFSIGLRMDGLHGFFILFAVFPAFAGATIVILLIMEGLSAFLHTLRLHWIEFQQKFYRGEGFAFEPLNFTEIIKASREA